MPKGSPVPGRNRDVPNGRGRIRDPRTGDPGQGEIRAKLAKEGRLWGMSAVCALGGALTLWRTGSVAYAIIAFLICLAVFGGALVAYERRRKR